MNAVGISDEQWKEVLWDRDEEEENARRATQVSVDGVSRNADAEDLFGKEDEAEPQIGDWHGIERDRRSAFLIIGALKQEGLL